VLRSSTFTHVHIEVAGYETLTTELFIDGDEYLDDGAVFGVKDSLVLERELNDSAEEAEKVGIWAPFCDIENDIVLYPAASAEAAE
jgi:hydroxyquinol 1,2-dioxygenase